MATLKYSRQRESIKTYLANTTDHPTADTVYLHVREEFPHISLGTVYRNLNLLAEIGDAIKINTPDGGCRFDGNITPHNHFFCRKCGSMIDLEMDAIDHVDEIARKNFDGIIESHSILFNGICPNCIPKN